MLSPPPRDALAMLFPGLEAAEAGREVDGREVPEEPMGGKGLEVDDEVVGRLPMPAVPMSCCGVVIVVAVAVSIPGQSISVEEEFGDCGTGGLPRCPSAGSGLRKPGLPEITDCGPGEGEEGEGEEEAFCF